MLGLAIGRIGMGYREFRELTAEEFISVAHAFEEKLQERTRDDWERMRLLATLTIQPHVKKRVRAQELIKFPWDNGKQVQIREREKVTMDKEQLRRRRKEIENN